VSTSPPFKWRHFTAEIILCSVRWYWRYALSYRQVEELRRERGLAVDHTTIFRWVQYLPRLSVHAAGNTSGGWSVSNAGG
jgi:transposase, IS6 family